MAEKAMIQAFSSGVITPKLGARSDVERYYSACQALDNFFCKPWGGVEKRPGTYLMADIPIGTLVPTYIGEYPTLQALTASEIPDAPNEPSVTAADTAVTDVRWKNLGWASLQPAPTQVSHLAQATCARREWYQSFPRGSSARTRRST